MFEVGDSVIIKHQRELEVFKVELDFDPIDEPITLPSGKIITGYVRIGNNKHLNLGYHLDSLEKVA